MSNEAQTQIGQHAIVPLWLVQSKLSGNAVKIYAYVSAKHADRATGQAWPSRGSIAEGVGLSTETVDKALKELVDFGAITRERRTRADGTFTSNLYTIVQLRPGILNNSTVQEKTRHGKDPCRVKPDNNEPESNANALTNQNQTLGPRENFDSSGIPSDVLADFKAQWEARYRSTYVFIAGKDAKMAATLLRALPLAELKVRIRRYIASEDDYYCRSKHAFSLFCMKVNELVTSRHNENPDAGKTREEIDREYFGNDPSWIGYKKAASGSR